ncbi:MAG: LamG-like jellyroll fold domain-containing protein, partial [Planctomycetota bacterium]|jgi:hypothetical protein
VQSASIQFTAKSADDVATNLTIHGHALGNAPALGKVAYDISSRPLTTASVNWAPSPWLSAGDAGAAQQTPDLSAVVQELVDRGDWASGNDVVFIIGGTGRRTAWSYNGNAAAAAVLTITYDTDLPTNTAPIAQNQSLWTDQDVALPVVLAANDADGDPLTYVVVDQPSSGVLSGTAPNVIYAPDAGFFGSDSFTFIANDGLADSGVATISLIVNQVDDEAPSVPQDVVLNVVSDSEIAVSWSPSVDNVGVIDYTVYRDGLAVATVTGVSYSDVGLEASTTYAYTIAANDGAGNSSVESVAVQATTDGAPTIDPDLLVWYPFDEGAGLTVGDATGNGHDATIGVQTWVVGESGFALDFNADGELVIPAAALSGLQDQVTVAMWVNGGDLQPQADTIFRAVNAAGGRVMSSHLPWKNGTVYMDFGSDGATAYDRINKSGLSPDIYKGSWHHWALVKNATTGVMEIYIDGSLWLSGAGKHRDLSGIVACVLGGENAGARYYDGSIDDLRIYGRALSAAEIAELSQPSASAQIQRHEDQEEVSFLYK